MHFAHSFAFEFKQKVWLKTSIVLLSPGVKNELTKKK
jgi:hypothetical protein